MRAFPLLALAVLLVGAQARSLSRPTGRGLTQDLTAIEKIISDVCWHIANARGARCTDTSIDGNTDWYQRYFKDLPIMSVAPTYGQYEVIKPAMPPDSVIGDTAVCNNTAPFTFTCNKQITFSRTDTVSWSTTNSLKVGYKTSLTIPGVGGEEMSFEYSFAVTSGTTTGKTRSFSDTCSAAVPVGGCIKCSMLVYVAQAHIKIPMRLALSGGVGIHHDPAISMDDDGDGRTHYYRWRTMSWVLNYAIQNGLVDAQEWEVDYSNAYWKTTLDVQGADVGSSTTVATPCDVSPLQSKPLLGGRPGSTHHTPAGRRGSGTTSSSQLRLPAPKPLVPRETGSPPRIRSKRAMSHPAFLKASQAKQPPKGRPQSV